MTDGELADRLHSTAIHLLRLARAGDAAAGVTAARLSVLSVLVYGGAGTVTELAAAEQVAVPTMTRLLQGMESDGYVRRRRDPGDQRVVRIAPTARGRRALEKGRAARLALLGGMVSRLAPEEQRALEAALGGLTRVLREARQADAAP